MDIDQLKNWIGKEESSQEQLTSTLVERYTATFDIDQTYQNGEAAPSLIHLCLCPPTLPTSELGPDGHPLRGSFLPPVPLPNRMWAGGAFTVHGDILVGDLIKRCSTIKDVYRKEGRSGLLCFVIVEHKIFSNDQLALTEIHNIVYKGQSANKTLEPTLPPASKGTYSETRTPSSTLLFRYSALTFNGHRIHYDLPYAQDIEGYPGLVVHGPLQATLLFHYAEKIKGTAPREFTYRNFSTIYDTADFFLNAESEMNKLKLWTAQENGPIAMEASAIW